MKYGDSVIYIKDGKPLNGIVLIANGDLLSILYADPESESLAFQGNLARIAQVARSVKPMVDGAMFGWESIIPPTAANYPKVEYPAYVVKMEDLLQLSNRIIDHAPDLEISPDAVVPSASTLVDRLFAQVQGLQSELAQTTEGRDKALQAIADADARKPISAPEWLDEVQGPVPAGDPESPHAIGGTPGIPNPEGGTFGVGTSTPNPSEAAPTTEVGEPQTTISEPTQASSETHSEN